MCISHFLLDSPLHLTMLSVGRRGLLLVFDQQVYSAGVRRHKVVNNERKKLVARSPRVAVTSLLNIPSHTARSSRCFILRFQGHIVAALHSTHPARLADFIAVIYYGHAI
jgi:hypothetical protein